jgi:hypothetical protein
MYLSQRFRPRLEPLEDRRTPAGTVTGSFFQGTWTLRGDADANNITINPTATPGKFDLIGNGTTVPAETPQGVKNIVIKLFAGDDVVTFNDTATQARLAGNLTVIGGNGANALFIDNAILNKKVTALNGTNTAGDDRFDVTDSIIKGKVFISNGDGNTNTIFRGETLPSSIGGLTVLNGFGKDENSLFSTNVASSVVFKNGRPDGGNQAGYLEIYNNSPSASRSVIGGNLNVSFKAGIINIGVTTIADLEVRGNVTFNCGSSTAEIPFDGYAVAQPVLIHGNLTLNGTGPLIITVGFYEKGTGLVVGKKLAITTGVNADTLQFHRLRVNGRTLINTGGGVDTVTIDDSRFLGPPPTVFAPFAFRLLTGAGGDTVNIDTTAATSFTTQFGSTVQVNLGGGNDTLTLGAAGDATRQVELFHKASFLGGLDNDTLNQLNVVSIFDLPIQAIP